AGPVDVFAFTVDGGMQLVPEGFSYGPTIVEITPDMSTAEGGRTGVIFGYGFGPVGSGVSGPLPQSTNSTSSGIPSSLQVKVAGNPVQVTGFARSEERRVGKSVDLGGGGRFKKKRKDNEM